MAVPKRRHSPARKGKRRSHHHRDGHQHTYCDRCGEPVLPHLVCGECGWSNTQNRELVVIKEKKKEE